MARWDWWQILKLACVTAGVAASQVFKFALLMADENDRDNRNRRRRLRDPNHSDNEQKGYLEGMSPELRQALVHMIDYNVTPALADQWRLGLVKVMLDPEEGPVLPDADPELRRALLESIETHQREQDRRPTFKEGGRPSRYGSTGAEVPQASRSKNGASTSRQSEPNQSSQASQPNRAIMGSPGVLRPVERAEARSQSPAGSSRDTLESRAMPHLPPRPGVDRPNEVLSQHQGQGETVQPSAPPLNPTGSLFSKAESPSAPPLEEEEYVEIEKPAAPEECGICMDTTVEVEINECHHKMCCECAKAICCLEGRAPQCPFCRGPMLGVSALAS